MVVFLEGDHSAQDEVLRGLEQVFVQYISTLGFRHLLLERLVCVATLLWIMDNFSYYFVHKQTDRCQCGCFVFFLNPFYKSSSFDLSITYGQHNIIAIVFFFTHFGFPFAGLCSVSVISSTAAAILIWRLILFPICSSITHYLCLGYSLYNSGAS